MPEHQRLDRRANRGRQNHLTTSVISSMLTPLGTVMSINHEHGLENRFEARPGRPETMPGVQDHRRPRFQGWEGHSRETPGDGRPAALAKSPIAPVRGPNPHFLTAETKTVFSAGGPAPFSPEK
jgi:hypothetical protein